MLPEIKEKQINRFRGCLIGLAVGDALGTTLEFSSPGTFAPLVNMVGGGPFNLLPGQWTDDTSMALCLADSLINQEGFDPQDQMERYLRWWHTGYWSSNGQAFDIGNTVRQALLRYQQDGDPYAGATDPYSAGNGSLMRLAPVVLFFAGQPEQALVHAALSSRTTHAAPAAVDACRYFAGLLLGALAGVPKHELLAENFSPVEGILDTNPLVPEIRAIAEGSFRYKMPPAIQGSGYVVKSLEAALWAFYHASDFRAGCLMAANLGDDADTTAAIFGQIAGAYYGLEGIPSEWLEKISLRPQIEEMADQLWLLAQDNRTGEGDG
ncbi:MAG: ADP-ribosylglycohydrolase family protein [Anaerolineales bacterium]